MEIENAKNFLIAIKEQIARNLANEDSLQFTKEFNNLIDNCNHSKTYVKFCIKLLERAKLNVGLDDKEVLLVITNIINHLSKKNGTKEEFVKAAYTAYTAYAAAAASASAYAAAEYKQQSIDLLQVLKTKAGRPKGSKNFIKKEKNVKILIPESLLSRVKKFISKLLNNETM